MLIQRTSQANVARAAGWGSHTSVGRLLRGEWTHVKDDQAQAIAEHLGVEVDDLFMAGTSSDARRNGESGVAA